MSLRVIKLGGSLLDLPGLAERLRQWLAMQKPLANVLVVGGGTMVEAIRIADRVHGLGNMAAHELSLDAMAVNASLIQKLVEGATLCKHPKDLNRAEGAPLQVLDVRPILVDSNLPALWKVTSDSIAAYVARMLEATELVLLKSTLPKETSTPVELAAKGVVDEYFPRAVGSYPIRLVNLRDAGFAEMRIPPAASGGNPES